MDLGGADGLIPVSEFSWQRVNDLNEFVKVGQEVEVLVARVDREARKIGLSVKQLTTSPCDEFADAREGRGATHRQGDADRRLRRVRGARARRRGADPRLGALDPARPPRPRRGQEGQSVEVEVLSVDPASRRIGLSLKAIAQEKEDAEDAAETAEREADVKAAQELMANRPVNPNLRGGIGGSPIRFDKE